MGEIVSLIVTIVIIAMVAIYLFKSFTKLIVGLGVAYFIFHIGFIWDYDKFDEKVPVMNYFKTEYSSGFRTWYNELVRQREEYAMLDINKMEKDIDSGIKTAIERAKDMYENINKEALIENIFSVIRDLNYEIAKSELLSMRSEFESQGITESEFNEIIARLDEMNSSIMELDDKLNQPNR